MYLVFSLLIRRSDVSRASLHFSKICCRLFTSSLMRTTSSAYRMSYGGARCGFEVRWFITILNTRGWVQKHRSSHQIRRLFRSDFALWLILDGTYLWQPLCNVCNARRHSGPLELAKLILSVPSRELFPGQWISCALTEYMASVVVLRATKPHWFSVTLVT